MDSGGRFLKALFGVLSLMGFIWFLLVGILESGETKTALKYSAGTARSFKHMKVVDVHPDTNLNYMSKRRVPNGSDPIHNRRAGNSGRPPGHA